MCLTCSSLTYYRLFVVCYGLLFSLIGILLLVFGATLLAANYDTDAVNGDLKKPALVSLVLGCIMIVSALIGVTAALFLSVRLLRFFLVVVVIAFVCQVAIGVVAYIYREQTFNVISNELSIALKGYTRNGEIRAAVDVLQNRFDCCGLQKGPSDWDVNWDYSCQNNESMLACSVPTSCCPRAERNKNPSCGISVRRDSTIRELYRRGFSTRGCVYYFEEWLVERYDYVGATVLGLAAIHIFGMFIVFELMVKVEEHQQIFKYVE